MQVEYEGRTYETEPSDEAHFCQNCGKKLREYWIFEWVRVEDEVPEFVRKLHGANKYRINFHHENGRKLYSRTYGYGWESFFCTLRCGYTRACKYLQC